MKRENMRLFRIAFLSLALVMIAAGFAWAGATALSFDTSLTTAPLTDEFGSGVGRWYIDSNGMLRTDITVTLSGDVENMDSDEYVWVGLYMADENNNEVGSSLPPLSGEDSGGLRLTKSYTTGYITLIVPPGTKGFLLDLDANIADGGSTFEEGYTRVGPFHQGDDPINLPEIPDVRVTASASDTSKIEVTFEKDKAKDSSVGGAFSFRVLSGDMVGVDDSHEDIVAMGDGNASAGMASITRAKPSQKPAGFGDEKDLSEILEAGKTYTLSFTASGASGGIPGYYHSQRAKFVVGGSEPVDTFTFTAAISTDKSSATVTFRKNGAVWDDLSGPFYYELYKFGSTEPVAPSSEKEGHARSGVGTCSFGAALADGTYEMKIIRSLDLNSDFEKYFDKQVAFKVGTTGLPFGDTEISELPDNGATLTATQNPETFDVTLRIDNPNLEDGESVTFHFVEDTQSQQGETSARAASRSASAALTLTKKVTAAADKKTFTASATQTELAGLKNGAKYAIEYINGDGSVLGYSTFTQGGLTFKAKGDDPTGSSSGCDAGFGALALALAACAATLRKKN